MGTVVLMVLAGLLTMKAVVVRCCYFFVRTVGLCLSLDLERDVSPRRDDDDDLVPERQRSSCLMMTPFDPLAIQSRLSIWKSPTDHEIRTVSCAGNKA